MNMMSPNFKLFKVNQLCSVEEWSVSVRPQLCVLKGIG
jgi:hypothetical protein